MGARAKFNFFEENSGVDETKKAEMGAVDIANFGRGMPEKQILPE